jgi:NADPH:quinone reductase-like Zn-dependent oxidoreductase
MDAMRALTLTSFNGLDALELSELPEPTPSEGEELVSVRAVALGPWDREATEGYFVALGGSSEFPQIQGWDFAGETADGRRVLGFVAQPWMGIGAMAEQIALPSALLAELPDEIDWAAGSALPVSALTAQLLIDSARVAAGEVVLVTGAAGMVGGLAVQLARSLGATVVGAVRDRDAAAARGLGAETTVSTGPDLEVEVRERWQDGVDACLDTLGLGAAALVCVRDGGAFATTVPGAVPEPARGIAPAAVQVQPDAAALEGLARRAAAGELPIRVAETIALDEFRRAYELLERGGLTGKVVLVL